MSASTSTRPAVTIHSDLVSILAIVYIAAPSVCLLIGWLRPWIGFPLTALLLFVLTKLCRVIPYRPDSAKGGKAAFLIVAGFAWAATSGAGHFLYANPDWRTRDAVYADLIVSTWPPGYGLIDGSALFLRSAMGYFLPPAAIAEWLPIAWAPSLLYLWTALGVALFFLLLPLQTRWPELLLGTLVVVLFSGMDFPAIVLIHGQTPIFPLSLEWWRPWTYTSLTGQLLWAPNHAVALWLGTALVFRHRHEPLFYDLCLILIPLLAIWTPFAVFGLLPWAAWVRLHQRGRNWRALRPDACWLPAWIFAAAMAAIASILFTTPGVAEQLTILAGDTVGGSSGPALTADNLIAYVQFAAFEFGILVLLLRPRQSKEQREMLGLATAILLALPLIRLGPSNDWILRVSTPSLLALLFLVLADIQSPSTNTMANRIRMLALALTLGAITPIVELSRSFTFPRTPANYGQSLVEQQEGFHPPHYIGVLHPEWQRWLFKPPSEVPRGHKRFATPSPSPYAPP